MAFKIKNEDTFPIKFTDWRMGHPVRYVLEPGEELVVVHEPPHGYVANGLTIKEIKSISKAISQKVTVNKTLRKVKEGLLEEIKEKIEE